MSLGFFEDLRVEEFSHRTAEAMPTDLANKEPQEGDKGFIAELLMWPLFLPLNFLSDLWQLL